MNPPATLAAGPDPSLVDGACSLQDRQQDTPQRTLDQRMCALAYANEIRAYRAQVKRDIAAGLLDWQHILTSTDPRLQTMKVLDVLLVVPKVGRVKATRALKRSACSPSKTIGGLSERQRRDLTSMRLKGRS